MKLPLKPSSLPQNRLLDFRIIWSNFKQSKKQKVLAAVGVLLLIVIVFAVNFYSHTKTVLQHIDWLETRSTYVKSAVNEQNLPKIQEQLGLLRINFENLEKELEYFSFTQYIPIVNNYWSDGQHIIASVYKGLDIADIAIAALKPYADVLGFTNDTTIIKTSTEDKIAELILLMPTLQPQIKQISDGIIVIQDEFSTIDPDRYPTNLKGKNIQEMLYQGKDILAQANDIAQQSGELIQVIPDALGANGPKRYLVLFQNDKELRPTGGFITSMTYLEFNEGRFSFDDNADIYSFGCEVQYLPIPWQVYNYLFQKYCIRDTNFSPDFAVSMQDFETYYNNLSNIPVDGILAVDTQFVESLLEVTGPISIPNYYKEFTAEPVEISGQQIPQVIYELELIAEKLLKGPDRKGIIGDLMGAMVDKILSEPLSKWSDYIDAILTDAREKHLLLNLHDPDAQALAEKYNFAGRISNVESPEDYLHINDANLAGRKSNLFLRQDMSQEITISNDGSVTKKITLTYTNAGEYSQWLNRAANNYVRVYVPLGSELISSSGGNQEVNVTEELGKTVFDNFVIIRPLASETITFEYKLPFAITNNTYSSLIQKQPGAMNWTYKTTVNGVENEILLDRDQEIHIEF